MSGDKVAKIRPHFFVRFAMNSSGVGGAGLWIACLFWCALVLFPFVLTDKPQDYSQLAFLMYFYHAEWSSMSNRLRISQHVWTLGHAVHDNCVKWATCLSYIPTISLAPQRQMSVALRWPLAFPGEQLMLTSMGGLVYSCSVGGTVITFSYREVRLASDF